MADTETTAAPSCANCQKSQAAGEASLRNCSRCKTTYYCSKDCQKADWKTHKKDCASKANANANASSSSGASSGTGSLRSPKAQMEALLGLNTKTWLHGKPETEVFTLLIDSYRMRVEDEYKFRGDVDEDSLYGGGDPTIGFRRFLRKAEKTQVFPSWWNAEKQNACVAQGNLRTEWSSLHSAVEKGDIQEHYKNNQMPMQLRMLAEEIGGSYIMA